MAQGECMNSLSLIKLPASENQRLAGKPPYSHCTQAHVGSRGEFTRYEGDLPGRSGSLPLAVGMETQGVPSKA